MRRYITLVLTAFVNSGDVSVQPQTRRPGISSEAQRRTALYTKNAGLIVTIDIGAANDIHPKNKPGVGRRMAVWALVRYAFNGNPKNANLTNESGLPATPFRTDDWPDPTAGKR